MNAQAPANWYPDPFGRFDVRYWDGAQWTSYVSSQGRQGTDPPLPLPQSSVQQVQLGSRARRKIQRQVRRTGIIATVQQYGRAVREPAAQPSIPGGEGGWIVARPAGLTQMPSRAEPSIPVSISPLFTEAVLVVNQKPKLIAANAEYAIFNQNGQRIGAVQEIGQSHLRNAVTGKRRGRSHRLVIVDYTGRVVMTLTRGETFARSKMVVRRPDGTEVGQIVQKTLGIFGKVRFDLESRGQVVGSIQAENWSVWNFSIQDRRGDEVAHLSKSGRGQTSSRSMKRDQYVVEIHRHLDDPLRSLVTATALAIDIALREE